MKETWYVNCNHAVKIAIRESSGCRRAKQRARLEKRLPQSLYYADADLQLLINQDGPGRTTTWCSSSGGTAPWSKE